MGANIVYIQARHRMLEILECKISLYRAIETTSHNLSSSFCSKRDLSQHSWSVIKNKLAQYGSGNSFDLKKGIKMVYCLTYQCSDDFIIDRRNEGFCACKINSLVDLPGDILHCYQKNTAQFALHSCYRYVPFLFLSINACSH